VAHRDRHLLDADVARLVPRFDVEVGRSRRGGHRERAVVLESVRGSVHPQLGRPERVPAQLDRGAELGDRHRVDGQRRRGAVDGEVDVGAVAGERQHGVRGADDEGVRAFGQLGHGERDPVAVARHGGGYAVEQHVHGGAPALRCDRHPAHRIRRHGTAVRQSGHGHVGAQPHHQNGDHAGDDERHRRRHEESPIVVDRAAHGHSFGRHRPITVTAVRRSGRRVDTMV
jgi:hypothetical protein